MSTSDQQDEAILIARKKAKQRFNLFGVASPTEPQAAERLSLPLRVCEFPHGGSDVPWSIKGFDGVVIADLQTEALANLFVHCVNQHDKLVAALCEVAIPSLRYCEEKYGYDDQARLNLEAVLTPEQEGKQ